MKRTITILTLLLSGNLIAVADQGKSVVNMDRNLLLFAGNAIAVLLTIWMASFFLLSIIRLILKYRLQRALIERNAPEEVIAQILPQKKNVLIEQSLKWGCLFLAIGLGLTLCYFYQPIGLHWAIIMSFSVAAGLFAFYFVVKKLQ